MELNYVDNIENGKWPLMMRTQKEISHLNMRKMR